MATNQPGSSGGEISAGGETGLYCNLNNGIIFTVSPTVAIGYAGLVTSNLSDGKGMNASGVTGGLVARFVVREAFYATFRAEHTISSFSDAKVNDDSTVDNANLTMFGVDANYRLTKDWMLNFFAKYLKLDSGSAALVDAQGHSVETQLRAGVNIIRTF